MKLLVVTQVVDKNDPVLAGYVQWLEELSKHYEKLSVICLKEGDYELPPNVQVYSLGKEKGRESRLVYTLRFKKLVWKLRNEYDAVFVHMNQEYLLISGWMWKLLKKRMYMWRNHYAGSWLTDVAASFCTNVFCTSKHSYTAKYKKTILMPVGIDSGIFTLDEHITRVPNSILFLARIAPSKRVEMVIEAASLLQKEGVPFSVSIYGDPLPEDDAYYATLKSRVSLEGLTSYVSFHPGVPNTQTPNVYRAHEVFVNCSRSGMFDKTLFEAAACGCLVLAISDDFAGLAGGDTYFTDAPSLASALKQQFALVPEAKFEKTKMLERVAFENSLSRLGDQLAKEII